MQNQKRLQHYSTYVDTETEMLGVHYIPKFSADHSQIQQTLLVHQTSDVIKTLQTANMCDGICLEYMTLL